MSSAFRIGLFVIGVVLIVFAAGYFIQAPWATMWWPAEQGRLSNIFVASILAAIGCPAIWIVLSNERRALVAASLDLAVVNAGLTLAALWFYRQAGDVRMALTALACAVLFVVFLWLIRYGRKVPFLDNRPMPMALRLAFGVFALLLAIVGTLLVLVRPNIFPWPLSPENSVIYGLIFLGAMVYFIHGLMHPVWGNAAGQMVGFLAYDVVLIVPFIRHFSAVQPEMWQSLVIYTCVVTGSAVIALYFLLLHPTTRFGAKAVVA